MRPQGLADRRQLQRPLRILALHGAPGNSNLLKFQSAALRKMAGEDFLWSFPEGPCGWQEVPGATQMNLAPSIWDVSGVSGSARRFLGLLGG